MALSTVTLRINAHDFTTEPVTAYAVITPTRTVRDPDADFMVVNQREFLPLGDTARASIQLVATGQGEPDDWLYRIELWAVDEPARMDPASPTGYLIIRGLVALPTGQSEYNLADLDFLDQPDTDVTYPRLDELLAAIDAAGATVVRAERVLGDIRDTDLGTIVDDMRAIRAAAQDAADHAAAAADAAEANVDEVRDAATAATAAVASMSGRMPDRGVRAVGKGELVVNAADYVRGNEIDDPAFLDETLRTERSTDGWYFGFTPAGSVISGRTGPLWVARNSSGPGGTRETLLGIDPIEVEPGETYIVGATWANYPLGSGGYVHPVVYVRHTDGSESIDEIGGNARSEIGDLGINFRELVDTWTAPADAASVTVGYRWTNPDDSRGVRLIDPVFRPEMDTVQAALHATPTGGTCYFPAGTYPLGSAPIVIPSDIAITGDGPHTVFDGDADGAFFLLAPRTDNVMLSDITVRGSMPPAGLVGGDSDPKPNQIGIDAPGASLAAPLRNIRIERCLFSSLEGIGVRLKHAHHLSIERCGFNRYGYAGIAAYSPNRASISYNEFTGTGVAPSWASDGGFGAFVAIDTADRDAGLEHPRPVDVKFHSNTVQNQTGVCLAARLGRRVTFSSNHVYDFDNDGIAAISEHPYTAASNTEDYGSTEIVIADNAISGRGPSRSQMGIRLRGGSSSANHVEYASGVITGNLLTWCGAHEDSNTAGAIQVAYARGVAVANNVIVEARSSGVVLHNCQSVIANSNNIIDVFRHDSQAAAAFRLTRTRQELCDVTLNSNRLSRGSLALAAPITHISDAAFIADPNSAQHTVIQSGNYWGSSREVSYSSNPRSLQSLGLIYNQTYGTSPPSWGSWSIGDRCFNQDPRNPAVIGWVCTASGSPGTWRPFGAVNLG